MDAAQQYLYRIIRFDHLIQMFEEGELHFSHPSQWPDPYETRLAHPAFNSVAAHCWCRHSVSDAMWRIYSPNQLGVRIKTTRTLLTNELQKAFPDKDRYYWMLGNVSYISQAEIEKRLTLLVERLRAKHKPTKALAPLLWKRRAFVHEAEIRAVVYDRQAQKPITEVKVPVDAHWLVQSVLIDPRAPPEIVDMYTHYLRTKLKYKRRVRQSELYAKRPPHPTTAE